MQDLRIQRKVKRLKELTRKSTTDWPTKRIEKVVLDRAKHIGGSNVLNKYSIWRRESDENSDAFVRLMRDQLIMARVYASIAQSQNRNQLFHDLRMRIRESQATLGEASIDSELPNRFFFYSPDFYSQLCSWLCKAMRKCIYRWIQQCNVL
jgi:alpha-1,4-galacturonosyltransferase